MRNISVSINDELHYKIEKLAQRRGLTIDECVASALRNYIENYENVHGLDLNSIGDSGSKPFLSVGE